MSILIKGMEMPKRCLDCPCFYDYMECMALHKAFRSDMHFDCTEERRYEGCPLVEIPTPHGRLIDADKAFDEVSGYYDKTELLDMLIDCTTVIEAEGEENE